MKEYSLLIDNQIVGPLPEDEIAKKIKEGEIESDTLIAEAGAAEWTPASEIIHVPTVRLSRKSAEEEKRIQNAKKEKLDPILRKKLLRYNLADAISVDKFSPEQAKAAVDVFEKGVRRRKQMMVWGGVATFLLVAGGGFALFSEVKLGAHRSLLAPVMESFIKPKEQYQNEAKQVARDVAAIEQLREDIEKLEFRMPKGTNPRSDFLSRVAILPEEANFITGKVDSTKLFSLILPESQKNTPPKLSIFTTKHRASYAVRNLIQKQIELLELLKTPLWTDEELRAKVAAELTPCFPQRKEVLETKALMNALARVTCETIADEPQKWTKRVESMLKTQDGQGKYHLAIERERLKTRTPSRELLAQLRQASTANEISKLPKDSPTKIAVVSWCVRAMPEFLDTFQEFTEKYKLSYSQKARDAAWEEFIAQNGAALEAEFAEGAATAIPLANDNTYKIPGQDQSRLCFLVKTDKYTLYVPEMDYRDKNNETIKPIVIEDKQKIIVRPEDVLMNDKYKVVKKQCAGNEPFQAKAKIMKRDIAIVRNSPEVYYIEVVRVSTEGQVKVNSRCTQPILLKVPDKANYDKLEIGKEVPVEELMGFEKFSQIKSPMPPSKLSKVQKEDSGK